MDEETTALADLTPGESSRLIALLEDDGRHLESLESGLLKDDPLADDARALRTTIARILLPALELSRKAKMLLRGDGRPIKANHESLGSELVQYFSDWRALMQKIITAQESATPGEIS